MELEESQNKSGLLKKIKIVKGDNSVTIEDTKSLSNAELVELITALMDKSFIKTAKVVNILVDAQINKEIDSLLRNSGFKENEEFIMVHKTLDEASKGEFGFSLSNLDEISINEFKSVWKESMEGSLNAPSLLNIDEQMHNVEVELGPNYKASCIAAYENGDPIGVIIPHIEAGTLSEGRIFYLGIIPKERGKGKSKILHQQALEVLKNDFKATCYIGGTGLNNLPMLKTFEKNGCTILERNKVYRRVIN